MPKLGMQSIRRRQLIDATLEAINEVGMHDATIAQIARRAGVSTGIISHYFRDKNGLLEATMRDITSQLRDAVLNRLHALPQLSLIHIYRGLSKAWRLIIPGWCGRFSPRWLPVGWPR